MSVGVWGPPQLTHVMTVCSQADPLVLQVWVGHVCASVACGTVQNRHLGGVLALKDVVAKVQALVALGVGGKLKSLFNFVGGAEGN